ncbi:MAG: phytanoyl-CoA dioxygenase family protein [Pseudomonadales bacterium]|jgi:ectoine hydroxylase-related dioxygenase (phytanoyl-CoA dioxygenase family)
MISQADKRRFEEQGYLLVENVVPDSLCARVRAAICEFLEMSEEDPASWPAEQSKGHGIVPIHHPQALWNVRQHPAVHRAFADLHGQDALWVTFDRVSFKTRDRNVITPGPADPIHWDGHPGRHARRSLQGLVYLTDTSADQGAFCCAPDLYRRLTDYLAEHPEHAETRRPEVPADQIHPVPGPAGSLVIWDRRMPHSSTFNLTDRPRWVQYVAMDPAADEAARAERVREFMEKRPPRWAVVQNVPGQLIPEPGPLPQLTGLGRRLVGLEPW